MPRFRNTHNPAAYSTINGLSLPTGQIPGNKVVNVMTFSRDGADFILALTDSGAMYVRKPAIGSKWSRFTGPFNVTAD